MANLLGSRTHASSQAYDVQVLAFPAASARTVQGLMQLFKIDQRAAERLIASVPLLLTQRVSGQEAEACAQALRKLGARVVIELSAGASTQQADWAQPSELEEDLLPQPRAAFTPANDSELEYDVLSAQEPGYTEHASISTSLRDGLDMELGTTEPDQMVDDVALRRPRQDAIELQAGRSQAPGLELDEPAPARQPKPKPEPERPRQKEATREPAAQQTVARPRAAEGGPVQHARAAVIDRTGRAADATRTIPLLQVCFALGVVAVGYWVDSSVIFGSASLSSVIVHGVALYQLILGVRGLAS
ncbi:MAG TPA: hypothetical protein VFN67_23565 [Polyangiales bacterium]|nr:hypothetical protein [Polyangiales bacterium]